MSDPQTFLTHFASCDRQAAAAALSDQSITLSALQLDMGQVLRTLLDYHLYQQDKQLDQVVDAGREKGTFQSAIPISDQSAGLLNLSEWPPELSLRVLSHLNATDLCLASGVWQVLALDELLWHSLCRTNWPYTSIYKRKDVRSYSKLYLVLDEGSVTFNADPFLGMAYLMQHQIVEDSPQEIARFLHHSKVLKRSQIRVYLQEHQQIIDHLVRLENFRNIDLSKALRKYFNHTIEAPTSTLEDSYLQTLIQKFSGRFCECNPNQGLNPDMVYILCYSLIMLSVDLNSPHIKNKMSKREFIKNLRRALQKIDDDLYGQLYDDVYLRGHIACFNDERSPL